MRNHHLPSFGVLLVAGFLAFPQAIPLADAGQTGPGQSPPRAETLRVLFEGVEADFLRSERGFIQPVDIAQAAQVLVRTEEGPGAAYALTFTGRLEFEGQSDVLTYRPDPGASLEAIRAGLSRTAKMGLIRFAAKTPLAPRIHVGFLDQVKPTAVSCPWDFWVFGLSASGMFNGESSYRSLMGFGNVSASRVTPEWKIRLGLSANYQKSVFSFSGFDYESVSKGNGFQGLVVRSLSDHWSVGAFVQAGSSTYANTAFNLIPTPALEYNAFPYSESTNKQLRFLYVVGPTFVRYREETIFLKTREILWGESLTVALDLKRPWGTISASLKGSHYFHDLSKNRVELDGDISMRIFKGLNFNIGGGGARVRDQLSLAKGGATIEETLLRRKQLETGYNFRFSAGFSYSFGSIFSNVVNPRFGNSGGSIQISM